MSTKVTQQVMDFVKSIAKNDGGRNEKYIDHKKGYMELCNLLSGNMLNLTEDDKDYLMGLKLEYENRYFPDCKNESQEGKTSTVEQEETSTLKETENKDNKTEEPKEELKEEPKKEADNKKEEPKATDKVPDKKPQVRTNKNKKKKRINPFDKKPRIIPKTPNKPSIQQKTVINKHIDNSHNNNYNYGNGNINIGGNMIISE